MALFRTNNTGIYHPVYTQADFSGARGITFIARFMIRGAGYHSNERILWALGDGSTRPIGGLLTLGSSFNHIRFVYNNDGGVGNVSVDAHDVPLQLDTYYNLAATIDAGGKWKMYLDEEVIAMGVSDTPLLVGANPRVIPMGRDSDWAMGPGLVGGLELARIWKRSFNDKQIPHLFGASIPNGDLVFENSFASQVGPFKAEDLGSGWDNFGNAPGDFVWGS